MCHEWIPWLNVRLAARRLTVFCALALIVIGGAADLRAASIVAEMQSADIPEELRRLKDADPAVDVVNAVKRGDLRFLAVRGFTVEVPGVPKTPEGGRLLGKYGTREIEGTGDDKMIVDLQMAAMRYAEKYDRLLFEHLKAR